MARYRTKQIEHETFQMTPYTRWNNCYWPTWLSIAWNTEGEGGVWPDPDDEKRTEGHESADAVCIGTIEGVVRCPIGYWIIQGVCGDLWCCNPNYFQGAYELVEETK